MKEFILNFRSSVKETIINFRSFLLRHFKNPQIRTLIWGLISYEMLSYVFWGVGTALVDFVVFTVVTAMGLDALLSNVISTFCAIIFAYVTNKKWVFKSKTNSLRELGHEFFKFAEARIATLIMTEFILLFSKLIHGNDYIAKIIAMVLTVIVNYILSKLLIFNKGKGKKNVNK